MSSEDDVPEENNEAAPPVPSHGNTAADKDTTAAPLETAEQPAPTNGGPDLSAEPGLSAEQPELSAEPGLSAEQPDLQAEQPGLSSEAPTGLQPSPGIAPPQGLHAPESREPDSFAPPSNEPQTSDAGVWQTQQGPDGFGQAQPWQPQAPMQEQAQQAQQYGQPTQNAHVPPAAPQSPQASSPEEPGHAVYAPPQVPGYLQQPQAGPGQTGGAAPQRSGMKPGVLVAIILGGVAVVIALVVIAVLFFGRIAGGGGGSASASNPSEAVEGFLTALSEGDADAALEYVDTPSSRALLTDEVLTASLELAPIDNIEVGEPYEGRYDQTTVDASFTIGGESVDRSFVVWDFSDGWVLTDALPGIPTSAFSGHDLTINGAIPDEDYQPVFPGTYAFELSSDDFQLAGGENVFTLTGEGDEEALRELMPELSEQGVDTFRALVAESLDECLALKTLTTPCGFSVEGESSEGYEPIDGTVKRVLSSEGKRQIEKLEPRVGYEDPLVVTSWDSIDVDITLEGEKDGQRVELELLWGGLMLNPTVDFGAADGPAITWED